MSIHPMRHRILMGELPEQQSHGHEVRPEKTETAPPVPRPPSMWGRARIDSRRRRLSCPVPIPCLCSVRSSMFLNANCFDCAQAPNGWDDSCSNEERGVCLLCPAFTHKNGTIEPRQAYPNEIQADADCKCSNRRKCRNKRHCTFMKDEHFTTPDGKRKGYCVGNAGIAAA